MKKIFAFFVINLCVFSSIFACDEATASINTITDNMDGTYTVSYDICVEYLGLEGSPYSWSINYNAPNTTVISSFSPPSISSGSGDIYTGTIRDGNCDALEDDVYGACDGVNNVLQYYTSETFPGNGGNVNLCFTVSTVISNYPTSVDIIVNSGETSFAACTQTLTFPVACDISAISIGSQSACNPADNTYTQQVTVTYTNPPASGVLIVNGQSFGIATSPQLVTLTNLTADGGNNTVTAQFSADTGCSLTFGNFTAPTSCTPTCNPDNGTWN